LSGWRERLGRAYRGGIVPTWQILRLTVRTMLGKDVSLVAAGLAFFALISMAPFLVIAIAVGGAIFGAEAAREEISERMSAELGPAVAEFLVNLVDGARDLRSLSIATLISALMLFWGSTRLFLELRRAIHLVWDIAHTAAANVRGAIFAYIKGRLLAALGVVAVGAVFLALLGSRVALNVVGDLIGATLVDVPLPILGVIEGVLALTVLSALVLLIYRVLPDRRPRFRYLLIGAAATASFLLLGRWLVALYVATGAIESAYGAAGSLVVFLIWAYYSSMAFLFGARLAYLVEHRLEVERDSPRLTHPVFEAIAPLEDEAEDR